MTVAYMPDGATFNGQQDIYTTEEAARLQPGDPLADPALNPLAYSIPDAERPDAATGADMTDADYPWEPPMAGTEAEQLTGALDRLRATFPLEGRRPGRRRAGRLASVPPR